MVAIAKAQKLGFLEFILYMTPGHAELGAGVLVLW